MAGMLALKRSPRWTRASASTPGAGPLPSFLEEGADKGRGDDNGAFVRGGWSPSKAVSLPLRAGLPPHSKTLREVVQVNAHVALP
jgi:hypothetical protein